MFSLLIVAMLAWALSEVHAWSYQSRIYPWSVGVSVLCLALVQLAIAVRNIFRSERAPKQGVSSNPQSFGHNEEAGHPLQDHAESNVIRGRVIIIQGWIIIFFLGIWVLGFKVGALVLTFVFLRLAASERWHVSAAFAVMAYLFFLVVFDVALQVPLGAGLIADYFELNSLDTYLVRPFLTALAR
jgi:hypothetical protein